MNDSCHGRTVKRLGQSKSSLQRHFPAILLVFDSGVRYSYMITSSIMAFVEWKLYLYEIYCFIWTLSRLQNVRPADTRDRQTERRNAQPCLSLSRSH